MSESVDNPEARKISYSQFSLWSTCAQSWKLKYHDKIRPFDQSIETTYGTSMHEAIQTWLQWRADGIVQPQTIAELFRARLLENFLKNAEVLNEETGEKRLLCDKATFQQYHREGQATLAALVEDADLYFPKHYKLLAIEQELFAPLNDHLAFTGFIDIVLYDEEAEQYIIIDLKTAKAGWGHWQKTDAKKLYQILLYKKYYADKLNIPLKNIRVEFIILARQPSGTERLERFVPEHGKLAVIAAEKKFEHFLKSTFDHSGNVKVGNLPPTPSKSNCRFCAFKDKKDLCAVGIDGT